MTTPLEGLDHPRLISEEVKAALGRVPREEFLPPHVSHLADENRALPIGLGQTISQPFIVALMSQEAKIHPGAKVLEIGTGSGYQAAILAELGAEVYSIEIIPELSKRAGKTLSQLGYADRVHLRTGDGWRGWKEEAPFDAILVTAAAPAVPKFLLQQLKDGGRLLFPLELDDHENLIAIRKAGARREITDLGGVKFVPVTGQVRAEYHRG